MHQSGDATRPRSATLALAVLLGACDSTPPPARALPPTAPTAASSSAPPGPGELSHATLHASAFTTSLDSLGNVQLQPQGRVLFRSGTELVVWDSEARVAPRRIPLGRDLAEASPLLPPTGSIFVVERATEKGERSLELWGLDGAAKVKELDPGLARRGVTITRHDFSTDGRRFLSFACKQLPPGKDGYTGWSTCEASVFAMPEGTLVHRTMLRQVQTDAYVVDVRLSRTGAYFALSHHLIETQAYESDTGRRSFVATGSEEYLDDRQRHFVFLDERHLLTATKSGAALLRTDLSGIDKISRIDLKLAPDEHATAHVVSPGGAHVAIAVTHESRCRVVIWPVDGGAPMDHVLPTDLCAHYTLRWTDADTVIAQGAEGARTGQTRVQVATRTAVDEAFVAHAAFDARGFRVFGDFDATLYRPGMAGLERRSVEGSQAPPRVQLPNGATVFPSSPPEANGTRLGVVDDRLLLISPRGATVFRKDGTSSELLPSEPPPAAGTGTTRKK